MNPSQITTVDPSVWCATFKEFRSQVFKSFQPRILDAINGDDTSVWIDVGGIAREGESSQSWPPQQWCIAFEILLCQTPTAITNLRPLQDDLLLFVYNNNASPPIFARRRSIALPPDLAWGTFLATQIDWRASILLNIVLQTIYTLTVVRSPLEILDEATTWPWNDNADEDILRVSVPVYASPTRVPVSIHTKKHIRIRQLLLGLRAEADEDEQPSETFYPDVCFAVDGTNDTFERMNLSKSSDCYCVLLDAHVEESWGKALKFGDGTAKTAAENMTPPPLHASQPARLFEGFVTHKQLEEVLRPSRIDTITAAFTKDSGNKVTEIRLRGPAGAGAADVSVSTTEKTGSSDTLSKPSGTSSSTFRALSKAAKGVVEAARGVKDPTSLDVHCALMSLSLNVDRIAEGILGNISV